jgi:hypothetical protein
MPRGPAGEKKKWLAIARDDALGGSHILIVEASTHKEAYEQTTHQCIMNRMRVPDMRAVYELKEESGAHICTVLDAANKGGLFNGRAALSLSPGAINARSRTGAV